MLIHDLLSLVLAACIIQGKPTNDQEKELLKLLDDNENEEVPKEKYEELGIKDGKYNGKNIKKITKIGGGGAGEALEKVLNIEDVESIKKIKDIKKVKNIMKIDEDLAEKIKKEVAEGGSIPETDSEPGLNVEDDPDLVEKVKRVLKMFNASDLDDIVKVVPIKSMKKITPGMEDYVPIMDPSMDTGNENEGPPEYEPNFSLPESNYVPNIPIMSEKRYSGNFEAENEAIRVLEDKIDAISANLMTNQMQLQRERALQRVLERMFDYQKEKLRMIKEVMQDHMAKEMELARTGQGINEMLKSAEREKIRRLKNLQGLAERHIGEIERDMPSALDFDDGSKINPFEVNPTLTDPYGLTGEGDVIKQQYIDSNKYDKLPLKKVKSIKKIKSILKLTPEQAERLKSWQLEREEKTGRRF